VLKQVELPSERTSVIPVERGLYLFKYASSQSEQPTAVEPGWRIKARPARI